MTLWRYAPTWKCERDYWKKARRTSFCMIALLAADLFSTVNKFVLAVAQDGELWTSIRENRALQLSINCKFLHFCCNHVFWPKTACDHPEDDSVCIATMTLSAKIKPFELKCTRVTESWFLISEVFLSYDMCVCLSTTRTVIVIYDEVTVSAVIPPKASSVSTQHWTHRPRVYWLLTCQVHHCASSGPLSHSC